MREYQRMELDLAPKDKDALRQLLRSGVQPVRVVLRALTLLDLARGATPPEVARRLSLAPKTIRSIGMRYQTGGLERALFELPRPGAKPLLTPSQGQRIIAMVCADPPAGQARWTVQLIAAQAVKRKLVAQVGRETIRILLVHHDLKPWREKNVVHRGTG